MMDTAWQLLDPNAKYLLECDLMRTTILISDRADLDILFCFQSLSVSIETNQFFLAPSVPKSAVLQLFRDISTLILRQF
jgi:hypothetical protein